MDDINFPVLMAASRFGGLEFLSSAVVLLDRHLAILYLNPTAEQLFEISGTHVTQLPIEQALFGAEALAATARHALEVQAGFLEHEVNIGGAHHPSLQLSCTITPVELDDADFFRPLAAIYKKNKVLSPAIRQFLSLLKEGGVKDGR